MIALRFHRKLFFDCVGQRQKRRTNQPLIFGIMLFQPRRVILFAS